MIAMENKGCKTDEMYKRSAIAVLGGSGFIGTRLASLLSERGMPFRIGDVRESAAFPHDWQWCDVCELEGLCRLVKGSDTVINLAAEHRDDVRPLARYQQVNVDGAARVCEVARETGVKQIIFTSSVAVYGFQPHPTDEQGLFAPFNEYGRTKLAAEAVYQAWAEEDSARSLVIVRPTVVFGEHNRGNVYNLLRQISTGKFMMVGSGRNAKSMAYVGNVAAFLLHSLSKGPGVHIYNYVDGPDMSTAELVDHIWHCLGKQGKPVRMPRGLAMAAGHGFDLLSRMSGRRFPISAIRVRKFCESTQFRAERIAQSGFVTPYSLQEGLARTIEFEFGSKNHSAY